MDKSLVQKLKWCKREVAALKIAHDRGMGTVSFFTSYDSLLALFDSMHNCVKITLQFEDLGFEPYCQCYISNAQYFQPISTNYNLSTNQLVILYRCYVNNVSLTVETKVVAASPILSIEMEAVYG